MSFRGASVAVVMPAYNVADRIRPAIETLPAFVDEVVVVDDGSCDATARTVASLRRPGLVLLRHPGNSGVGAAIATGYAEALRREAAVVAVMAGDGQMDPSDLPAVVEPVALGAADYVKGNRFWHREVWRAMPLDRLLGNVVLSLLTKLTSGYHHLFDSQCGFTAISGRAIRAIEGKLFSRYGYPNDLLARLHAVGARVLEVPVRPVYDGQRSGIRFHTVLHPILSVLARSFGRRLWSERLRPFLGLGARPAPLRLAGMDGPRALGAKSAEALLPAPPARPR